MVTTLAQNKTIETIECDSFQLHFIDYLWGEVFRDIDITKGLETFDKPVFLGLGQFYFLVAPFFCMVSHCQEIQKFDYSFI